MKKAKLCVAFCAATLLCRADEPLPGMLTTNMAARLFPAIVPPGAYGLNSWYRGIMLQGPLNNTGGKADLVRFARGGQVAQNWYETFDANHGWIVFWVMPEWDGNDGKERCLLQWSENGFIKKTAASELVFSAAAGASVSTNISAWKAGAAYRVDAFWNAFNTVNGTHHLGLGVNLTNVFGATSSYAPEPPVEFIHVGSSLQTNCAANVFLAGLTIFRRYDTNTLFTFNPTTGHNVASWDMPFGMPVNPGNERFTGGATHAHTHPFTNTSLLPGNNRMGGYMLAGNYATDGWSLEGSPTAAAMAAAQKLYRGGYQTASSGANQGLYQDIPATPGTNIVMRVAAHSDGVAIPRAIFHNQTAGTAIGQLTGRSGSTRFDPDILIFPCQAPAGCNTIRIKLVNTQSSGTVYWHQAEVLNNRVVNPSAETGSGDPWVPTGWSCSYPAGEGFQETANVHSGTSAVRIQSTFGWKSYTAPASGLSTFNSVGWFGCRLSGNFHFISLYPIWRPETYVETWYKYDVNSNYWHHAFICKSAGTLSFRSSGAGKCFTDDLYAFPLRAVPILATPASPSGSIEGYHGTRVDGLDRFVGVYTNLGPTEGNLRWYYMPRHSASCAVNFGHPRVVEFSQTNAHAYIATMWGDADNYIRIYWASNDMVRLRYRMNAADGKADWQNTGIEAGSGCRMQLLYNGGGDMSLWVQRNEKPSSAPAISIPGIPAAFSVAPTNVCWGARWDGTNATFQGDAVFGPWPPGTVVRFF